jgi:hypothetical protein
MPYQNSKRNVKWHLVMMGSKLMNAMEARDNQKLEKDWKWTTGVYASELPEEHAERLQVGTILNDVKYTEIT